MMSTVFCDITPCSLLKVNGRSRGTCRLHLQGRTSKEPARKPVALLAAFLHDTVAPPTPFLAFALQRTGEYDAGMSLML
jgi:hypothetical protein